MTICQAFYHSPTYTWTYVVADEGTRRAVVIDPVLDYEPKSARIGDESIQKVMAFVKDHDLKLMWVLETHAHADHLSAAAWLHEHYQVPVAIGEGITQVQTTFREVFNLNDLPVDGRPFDRLFASQDQFRIGDLDAKVMHTPGHTNDSVAYLIDDMAFIGDTLFAPDYGTARCDFPGGDAGRLYDSIQQLYALPDATRLMLCHDYPPPSRQPRFETTVAEQKADNVHLNGDTTREQFIAMRTERDRGLSAPQLILPSIQVNIRAGRLPESEDNGTRYLKIPLNRL